MKKQPLTILCESRKNLFFLSFFIFRKAVPGLNYIEDEDLEGFH